MLKEKIIDNWDQIMKLLESQYNINNIIIKTWIDTLILHRVENKKAFFYVDAKRGIYGVNYLRDKGYDLFLLSAIRECINDAEIEIEIDVYENIVKTEEISSYPSDKYYYESQVEKMGLNPKYTFENFVVGDSNNMAYVTCTAVADLPGQNHLNPLFLYGESGVGKTHLIQSIAHYILKHNTKLKVIYVPAEVFVSDIVSAIQRRETNEVKEEYRSADVLIIDDIQVIIGKESTQAEFFNTFNVLHSSGKQIVLSSDKPPSEMKTLEARLRSRFEWGIPIDIHVPDYETRMAILKNKAEKSNLTDISEDVLTYIAENIVSNVRELESALNKIRVYRQLGQKEVTLALAQQILRDLISKDTKQEITPEIIMSVVAEHLGVAVEDIKSKKRTKSIAQARQMVMYLCRVLTDKGLQDIGDAVGGKDHATVISGIKRIEEKKKADAEFDAQLEVIKKKIGVE